MTGKASLGQLGALGEPFRVAAGAGFTLRRCPTGHAYPASLTKREAPALMEAATQRLAVLQERLYAHRSWSLLLVLQGMDASGKDSIVRRVMSGVNPQGVAVTSFKAPGPDELAHDFLFRIVRALPARGTIGIFNRSHYEEVVVPRVHPELLDKQHLPPSVRGGPRFWEHRLESIAGFERHLGRQGTRVLKVFLHLGREEQKERLLERLDDPGKHWKFDPADLEERDAWEDYLDAYEAAIAATATEAAPWFVVPADQKWFTALVVMAVVLGALEGLDLPPAPPSPEKQKELEAARERLRRN